MPKATRFEIRDARQGGMVLTDEEVMLEMPAEYKAFMKRLEQVQFARRDYPAFGDKKSLQEYVRVKFVRMHDEKDETFVGLGTLFPNLRTTHCLDMATMIGQVPLLSYATGSSPFNHIFMWAGELSLEKVLVTGCPEAACYETACYDKRTMQTLSKRMREMCGIKDLPSVPIFSNSANGGVVVSHRPSKKGSIVGIAVSSARICVKCEALATVETASQFKMCKRCKDSVGLPVWYCSKECQVDDYERHRGICKAAFGIAKELGRAITVGRGDSKESGAVCQACGAVPTWDTMCHFVRCPRCFRCAGKEFFYCGLNCQRAHYSHHVEACKRQMFGTESYVWLKDLITRGISDEEVVDTLTSDEKDMLIDLVGNPYKSAKGEKMKQEFFQELIALHMEKLESDSFSLESLEVEDGSDEFGVESVE